MFLASDTCRLCDATVTNTGATVPLCFHGVFTVHNHSVMLLVTGNAREVGDNSDFTVVKTLTQGCEVFGTTAPQ